MKESPWFLTRNGTASGNLNIVTACKGIKDTKHNKAGYNRQALSLRDQYECCDECLCFNTRPLDQPASISHQTDAQKVADCSREREVVYLRPLILLNTLMTTRLILKTTTVIYVQTFCTHMTGVCGRIVGKWLGAMHVKAHERYGSQNCIYKLLTRSVGWSFTFMTLQILV